MLKGVQKIEQRTGAHGFECWHDPGLPSTGAWELCRVSRGVDPHLLLPGALYTEAKYSGFR